MKPPLATLPTNPNPRELDALHDHPAAWQPVVEALARQLGQNGAVRPVGDGTVLVALLGAESVLKLYPPFLRDHWAFECGLLTRLHGYLRVSTPRLLRRGEHQGWTYTLMSQLTGTPLTQRWPLMSEAARLALLNRIGRLAAEVHALPVGEQASLAPPWAEFIARQRAGCLARQTRTGLPAHLLAQVEAFISVPLPSTADVLLTGEYAPMNLFVDAHDALCALFDFGDGLIGPAAYDFGGPLCFLAAGHAARVEAFCTGYGLRKFDREVQLRLLLLHRYSHLPLQLAGCPGWEQAATLPELAARLWPCGSD